MKKLLFILLFLFAPILEAQTLVDSYSESNRDGAISIYTNNSVQVSQGFKGNGYKLSSCKFYMSKIGTVSNYTRAYLYTNGGSTFGSDDIPTGAALASSTLYENTAGSLPGYANFSLVTFTFDQTYVLVNNTNYCIVVEFDGGGNSDNKVVVGLKGSLIDGKGSVALKQTTWATYGFRTCCFYVYGTAPPAGGATKHDKPPIIRISQ